MLGDPKRRKSCTLRRLGRAGGGKVELHGRYVLRRLRLIEMYRRSSKGVWSLVVMAGPRDYSESTRAALAMLSRGRCYYPSCGRSIIVFNNGEPYIDYQIAHIYDAKPGNRYRSDMSDEERRAFSNLILLCKPHHEEIDKRHPEKYSAEVLLEWKRTHEGDQLQPLAELGAVSEESLAELLVEAAISIGDSIVNVGGQGGNAPGAGGGGGGVIGSGTGGPGGNAAGFRCLTGCG